MPRDSAFLVECAGMVGKDGVLQALDQITRIDTSVITDGWPYPNILVGVKHIVVCGSDKIYEWNGTGLDLKLTLTAGQVGGTWRWLDGHDFMYLSNGKVAVLRDPQSHTYSVTTDQPIAHAICNFNGQPFIGAPGVEI